jgi:hypothetical protein
MCWASHFLHRPFRGTSDSRAAVLTERLLPEGRLHGETSCTGGAPNIAAPQCQSHGTE